MLAAIRAIEQQRGRLFWIRGELRRFAVLVEVMEGLGRPENLILRMRRVAVTVAQELLELQRALAVVPYPFSHVRGGLDLGAVLVPAALAPGAFGEALDAANRALGQADLTASRIWGRLAATVEQIEQRLGLPPVEMPADSRAQVAA